MTKITLGPYPAAIAAEMLDFDEGSVWNFNPVAPFDDDRPGVRELIDPNVCEFGAVFDSIEIDVSQLQPARIDAHQLERRAGHRRR